MSKDERSAAARYLGARGGRATAAKLTPEQRTANARKAGKARAAQRWGAVVKVEQAPKPRRPLPKAGTVNALVLAAVDTIPMTVDAIYERAADVFGYDRVRNALSSLRSGGHVVSEPKPGSRREKLWRLA